MSQVLIPGAVIRKVITHNKAPKVIEFHIEADWAEPFCNELKIATPSDMYSKSKLNLSLNMANMIFTPSEQEIQKYEIDVNCSVARDFYYVPKLTGKGTIKSREVHFKLFAGGPAVAGCLENYIDHVGDHPGTIKLVYNEQTAVEEGDSDDNIDDDQMNLGEETDEETGEESGETAETQPEKKRRGRKAKK